MNISTSTQITPLPKAHEASALRPKRDSDNIQTLWKKLNEAIISQNKSNQLINQLSREFKKLKERGTMDFGFFPFEIYTLPVEFRPTGDIAQYTASINWRTVRIRGGLVLTETVSTGSFVWGTDMMQNYSYDSILPPSNVGTYDIQVPQNTPQYWFWIENSGSANISGSSQYYLRYSADPTMADDIGNPVPWATFPSASSNYIPIGYVDTATSGSINVIYSRQFVNSDIILQGGASSGSQGIRWSEYTPSASYTKFVDFVRLADGSQNAGTYLCGVTVSSSINPPVLPEPVGTVYWIFFAQGTQNVTDCQGNSIIISSTPL